MIGQVRFAWINFKRSFTTSVFSSISLIVSYSAIIFSIAMYSIVNPYLYWSLTNTFYNSYSWMGIVFIVVSIIIGGVVTTRSIDLKFHNQKDDIAIMKNVGGKNKWIYSYFIFNQIITAVIMLLFGLAISLILLVIIFNSFNLGVLFSSIKFIPILGSSFAILFIAYVKSHYTILKFIGEKDFEVSSGKLSNYKSIFEFNAILIKLKTTSKIAMKNYLRSGKILASFLFSFFLAFSIISFAFGPVSITETYSDQIDNRFSGITYIIGQEGVIDFYTLNLGAQPYSNSPYIEDVNSDIKFFNNLTINSSLIGDLEATSIVIQKYFITKLLVQEVKYLDVSSSGMPVFIGDNRIFYSTVIGCEYFPVNDDSFLWGKRPNNGEVIIGESLDKRIFENSMLQKIWTMQNCSSYAISGVIQDTFASGFAIYMSMNELIMDTLATGPNMISIGELNSTDFQMVSSIVESHGYSIRSLNELTRESKKKYLAFSTIYELLGVILFLIFSFQIVVFAFLYVLSYRKDYELLYKLGISKKKITKISVKSTLMQVIPGMVFGTYFGSILTRYFLIPYAYTAYYIPFLFGIMIWFLLIAYLGSKIASKIQLKQVYEKIYLNKVMRY